MYPSGKLIGQCRLRSETKKQRTTDAPQRANMRLSSPITAAGPSPIQTGFPIKPQGAPKLLMMSTSESEHGKSRKFFGLHSPERESSHGSSSLSALECSALGAVVQEGSGSFTFFFLGWISDSSFVRSSMGLPPFIGRPNLSPKLKTPFKDVKPL